MADHRNVGLAAIDAARDAGNRWVFPELLDEGLEPWNGARRIFVNASPFATHAVDVTDTIDRGIASLREHEAYLAGLGDGGMSDPEPFLRGMAEQAGAAVRRTCSRSPSSSSSGDRLAAQCAAPAVVGRRPARAALVLRVQRAIDEQLEQGVVARRRTRSRCTPRTPARARPVSSASTATPETVNSSSTS